jgi:septal ring factor EnvC (AmiA/AmiB activator)
MRLNLNMSAPANTRQELESALADKKATREGLESQLARNEKDTAELTEALSKLEDKPTKK